MKKTVLFLVGPTASGKTELSLLLAKRLNGEIISADSMLVYRGMDIGTAKPSRRDRHKIPHHLIDLVSPRSNYSVYLHRKRTLRVLDEVLKRNRIPLVVAGGSLYLEAIWKGLSPQPAGDRRLREKLIAEESEKGTPFLYRRLQAVNPARAREIHPHDRRRIVRALEIAELSGRKPSERSPQRQSLSDLGYSILIFGIERDRKELYDRIDCRVERMFRKGWLREVERLRKTGFSRTARQALGYREILEAFRRNKDEVKKSELVRLIQKRTRQFAKRQLTWLRRENEICWIPWKEGEAASEVCDKIIKDVRLWLKKEPC